MKLPLWYHKWIVNRSLRALDALDWNMYRAGWTRTETRQFWHDFTKKRLVREETLNRLAQQWSNIWHKQG